MSEIQLTVEGSILKHVVVFLYPAREHKHFRSLLGEPPL